MQKKPIIFISNLGLMGGKKKFKSLKNEKN